MIEDIPVGRRPVVETQHEAIIHERHGMSGAAIAALVIAGIAAAALITWMIVSSNNQNREAQLQMERDRAEADARRAASQPNSTPSQPQVVVVPSQPTTVPVPVPVPVPSASSSSPSTGSAPAVSDASIEIDVTTKMLDDQELRKHPLDVKVSGGTATLSGNVPSEELKTRAEKAAMTVKGVKRVVNNITVTNQ